MPDRYFVGQRVRLRAGLLNAGARGTIIAPQELLWDTEDQRPAVLYPVRWDDGFGEWVKSFDCVCGAAAEQDLEPIPDDRAAFERFMVRATSPRKILSVASTQEEHAK